MDSSDGSFEASDPSLVGSLSGSVSDVRDGQGVEKWWQRGCLAAHGLDDL